MKYCFKLMAWFLIIGIALLVIDNILYFAIGSTKPIFFTLGFLCIAGFLTALFYNVLVAIIGLFKK